MGVIGLWGLLEPAGKPVPLESLENKILAVDVSIWLNQAVKGYRDKSGNAVTNAHLLGLFHRISKLLFYKIKPVFVFDGKAPDLKKETLQRRRIRKGDASKKARVASAKILDNYVRSQAVAAQLKQHTHAVNKILSKGSDGLQDVLHNRTQKGDKDLFELPPLPDSSQQSIHDLDSDSDQEEYKEDLLRQINATDIHSMDVSSKEFRALPKELQYEVLSELIERRKQSSWNRMHEMPKSGGSFSGFQMKRLLNRSKVHKAKEDVGKEIGEDSALQVDANLFVGDIEGIKKAKAEAKRVMSSASGHHILYVKDLKKATTLAASTSRTEIKEEDDEVQILEPSSFIHASNRSGGLFAVKQEVLEEQDEEDIYQDEILKVIQSEAGLNKDTEPMPGSSKSYQPKESPMISDASDSNDEDSNDSFEDVPASSNTKKSIQIEINLSLKNDSDDDLFKDVFENEKAQQNSISIEFDPNKKVDEEEDDLFKDVFEDEAKPQSSMSMEINPEKVQDSEDDMFKDVFDEEPDQTKSKSSIEVAIRTDKQMDDDLFADVFKTPDIIDTDEIPTDVPKSDPTENMAEKMKQSDHLYLKIASKYMERKGSDNKEELLKKEKNYDKADVFDELDMETEKLIQEMKSNSKEKRLMKIKDLDQLQSEETKEMTKEPSKDDTKKVLEGLGVRHLNQEDYQAQVEQESSLTKGEVYGDSVAGFVRSSRDANVQEPDHEPTGIEIDEEILEKLDKEGEEFSRDELLELQNKLAQEQEGLIAERGQLDRLAATITDQMYNECQELLQLFGIPWIIAPSEVQFQ